MTATAIKADPTPRKEFLVVSTATLGAAIGLFFLPETLPKTAKGERNSR